MRFLPVNLNAILVELDDLNETLALFGALQSDPIAGVEEIIPAARTLLIYFRPEAVRRDELIADIASRDVSRRTERASQLIKIPVHYNGEDLADVAQGLGISVDELIRRHTGSDYSVAFTGFAPGFAYLTGGAEFRVPRRATPRTKIPAGAVALAGEFSGIYPQASPGGWQILGVTPLKMWDLSREQPALLQPGYRVRFYDAGPQPDSPPADEPAAPSADAPQGKDVLEIVSPGLQSLLQDLGRPGLTGQGVSASGALDRGALRAANRAVGNPIGSACIEILHGGLSLVCRGRALVAVTGARMPLILTTRDGASLPAEAWRPLLLEDGDRLTLGVAQQGLRGYLAVRGGFAVEPVLGSLSRDTLAQLGPQPLSAGDRLAIGGVGARHAVSLSEEPADDLPTSQQVVTLDVVMGPRSDWFTEQALRLLASQLWLVTPQSNRVGIRLSGEQPLTRSNQSELPSEGTSPGAIQVPASGQPVLFLADHPLTGGYPVIGAVASYHLDLAGQIPPGARIRFNPITTFCELDDTQPHPNDQKKTL
ncbi:MULTISPECIES: 5-oxoprolinase/urea amidolyase family protein [unclassified Brenneria]|uniref:5-oxoprolinase subunit B/C family protein n=1 Tax=unclassified Brenneria TaxID=2634434 RepID=UPI0029C1CE7D|nr:MULTISPECIES: 5-oxoprolinase/urea amidolyase family protein [unclassified Brenneria]MDX5630199.1 5-oxoprolinase/urea amidolyase family protein [Brenneria sp. L3-3Z]MDX5697344.1 5-oxoprolinase/urea amidolyase family protein [Brenneria sp. L4-2C]